MKKDCYNRLMVAGTIGATASRMHKVNWLYQFDRTDIFHARNEKSRFSTAEFSAALNQNFGRSEREFNEQDSI